MKLRLTMNWKIGRSKRTNAIPVNMGIDQPLMYMGTNQPPPPPGKWPFLLSIAAWLISLALIFTAHAVTWDGNFTNVTSGISGGRARGISAGI